MGVLGPQVAADDIGVDHRFAHQALGIAGLDRQGTDGLVGEAFEYLGA